jgi:Phage tail tube protein
MARAYGSSAHLLMKRETAYGQAATGDYIRMPFNRCNLGSEQGLIDDPVLGQGRDPLAPLQDVINDEGDIVVPVDPRYLGLWLTGLFGDPDTTDNLDGSWDHEFTSGGDDLPSYTIEVGMPKVPAFFLHAGVKLNSIALEFTRSGPAAATINAIAQGETRFGTTQGGTPTSLTFSRISQFQGSIKRAGDPVGNLTGGSVTYSNNLEKIETIRDDGLIEGADPTIAALTGRIDVRFADTTLIDLAADRRRVDLSGLEQHIGTWMPVEHELPVAVGAQGDERERGPGFAREAHRVDIDARRGERLDQEVPERVVADLAHERAPHAETCQADGDVGRRPARSLLERRRRGQRRRRDGRDKINQDFAKAYNVGHGAAPSSVGGRRAYQTAADAHTDHRQRRSPEVEVLPQSKCCRTNTALLN